MFEKVGSITTKFKTTPHSPGRPYCPNKRHLAVIKVWTRTNFDPITPKKVITYNISRFFMGICIIFCLDQNPRILFKGVSIGITTTISDWDHLNSWDRRIKAVEYKKVKRIRVRDLTQTINNRIGYVYTIQGTLCGFSPYPGFRRPMLI